MTQEFFNDFFRWWVGRQDDVLCSKAAEYAGDGNRAHNFEVASRFTGRDRKEECFNFMLKHLVSIRDLCLSDEPNSKDLWMEKLMDAGNYIILLAAMVAEEDEYGKR